MSLAFLRRCRLLALLLLLLSPGAGGSVLPLLHPCPVDSPWLLPAASGGSHAGHHGGTAAATDSEHHDRSCHCVGSCAVSAAVSPPSPAVVAAPLGAPAAQGWASHDATLLLGARAELLPPATAPPLA